MQIQSDCIADLPFAVRFLYFLFFAYFHHSLGQASDYTYSCMSERETELDIFRSYIQSLSAAAAGYKYI